MFERNFWKEVLHTLMMQKRRSLFTLFGVFWGLMLLVLLLGAGMGFQGGMVKQLMDVESNSVGMTASPTSVAYGGFENGREWLFDDDDIAALHRKYSKEIARTVLISHFPDKSTLSVITAGQNSEMASLVGISPDYPEITPLKIIAGRGINSFDCDGRRKVCVLGEHLARSLFDDMDAAIGTKVNINDNAYTVAGVVRMTNPVATFNVNIANDIFLPVTTAAFVFGKTGKYETVVSVLNEGYDSADYMEKMPAFLKERHSVAPDDVAALTVLDLNNFYGMFTSILIAVKGFVWLIGLGTLLTGLIGISDIMMISVIERTQEIGVRLAFGAPPSAITKQVVCESMVLTLIGGLTGIIVGGWGVYLIGKVVNTSDSSIFANLYVPLDTVVVAFLILVIGGLAAGYMPARHAMSIKAIEALREE